MDFDGPDYIATALCIAVCAMILFPMFRSECMDERAAIVYEQLIMACVAIVSAYVGSNLGRRR